MATVNHPEFQTYLQSISDKYKRWWNLYTLTDAEGKKIHEQQFSSPFDFGLMVQTVQPKQEQQNQEQEKVERLPVLEGIRKYANNHVLLRGKPGSGKSTALQRLLWEDAEAIIQGEKQIIPILVELRNWDTSVETLIYKFLRKNKLRIDKDKIEDLLFDGELLLLMDGLNELPSDKARDNVAQFRQDYSDTPMIFTTRDLAVGGNLGINKQLEMQPLTETQMREFVIAYLPQQGERMLQQLNNRLRELGETPLILKMLCDVFQLGGEIPENKGELFRQFDSKVNRLKEDKETVPIPEGLRRWKGELLQYLAFEMMQPKNPQSNSTDFRLSISRSQTEAILENFLKGRVDFSGKKEWLDGLLKHCLLESKTSESEQVVIEFYHQLFQEYYAAEYFLLRLLPNLSDEKLKRDYLNLLKWTEPLALMLGLVEDEAQALRVVRLGLEVDLMLGARLAGEVRKEFQEKTVGFIRKKDLPQILKNKLLGLTRSEYALTDLKEVFNHQNTKVRSSAVSALAQINSKKVIIELLLVLQEEETEDVYVKAAEWLAEWNCKEAIPGLNKKIADWNLLVQKQKYVSDSNIFIWARLVEALGKLSKQDAILELHEKILKELDEDEFCFIILLDIGKILARFDNESIISELFDILEDKKNDNLEIFDFRKVNAIRILGQLGNKLAIPKLLKILKENNTVYIHENIFDALVNIDQNVAISILVDALQNNNPHIRKKVAETLIKINNKKSITGLCKIISHPDENIRWAACIVLGKLGSLEALPILVDNLKNRYPGIRETAAIILSDIKSETVNKALYEALNDDCYYVRRSIAIALAKNNCSGAIPELLKALIHYRTNLNLSVILDAEQVAIEGINQEELNKLGDEDAINRWLFELRLNFNIFVEIAEALGNLGTEAAIVGLSKILVEHSNIAAAITLGKLGKKDAIPILLKNFKSSHPDLRKKIVDALVNSANEEVIKYLINYLDDKDFHVRYSAADALIKIGDSIVISHIWLMRLQEIEDFAYVDAAYTIKAIQNSCQFYNHEIFHSPSIEEDKNSDTSNSPNINIFNAPVGNINAGDTTIQNQIGTQNNQQT